MLVLVLLVLVPSKGQLPICYSYFRQAPPRSAQVKQPCVAFDAIRLVTKVLVSDLVHIGFWQKKGAINISMTEAKRANAKICLTNWLKCKHKQALHEKYCPGLTYDGIGFGDKAENGMRCTSTD